MPKVNPYYRGPASDHFDGTRFFNPNGRQPRGMGDLLRWQLGRGKVRWPTHYPSPFQQAKPELSIEADRLRVTMIGHASLLIQVHGFNILTDPVWARRVSPFSFVGPARRNAPGIEMDDLPPIDLVLVTHNHYDHLDLDTLAALNEEHSPLIVTPLGNDTIIRRAVPDATISVLDWGDRLDLEDELVIHAEPCHHWSARGSGDRRMALWAAFVIETLLARFTTSATPAFTAASTIAPPAKNMAASASPTCPSAPTSRAGSCRIITRTRKRRCRA